MSEGGQVRLHLVGDDDALDLIAELARHLPIAELSRTDVVPERALDADDIVLIGVRHPRTRASLLRDALARGHARYVALVSEAAADPVTAGARAIVAAADLVRLLVPELVQDHATDRGPPTRS